MPRVLLQHESLRLELDPALGAAITDFSVREPAGEWCPVLRRAVAQEPGPFGTACFLMAPWCNRIAHGLLRFRGREWALPLDPPEPAAHHGEVRRRPFRILDRAPHAARLECDLRDPASRSWPWPYRVVARYELAPAGFEVDLTLINESGSPMPAGLGLHPYFMRRLWRDDDRVRLRLASRGRVPLRNFVPAGEPRPDALSDHLRAGGPLGDSPLDDLFAQADPTSEILWPSSGLRARCRASDALAHAHVYAPAASPWFCAEPVSMLPDAIGMLDRGEPGSGLTILEPGQTLAATWSITLDRPGETP